MTHSPSPTPPELPGFLSSRLPFERRLFALPAGPDSGRRIHYLESGKDTEQPVLLLHGNPTWSFLWRKVMARLEGLRAIAPDLLGLGCSDRFPRPEDHAVARHADAIAQLVEHLDLQNLVLVGQDWGGPIAAAVGARCPERVAGAVFGNTAVILPKQPRGTAFHRFARLPELSTFAFQVLNLPLRFLHRFQGDPASIRGDVARAYRWPLRSWTDRRTPLMLARMVPDGPDHPSIRELQRGEAWLRGFDGPVALVWGEKDPVLGRALSRHTKSLPAARVTRCPGAGHFLQEEVPDELADAIRWAAG